MRQENQVDIDFCKSEDISTLNLDVRKFYNDIKSQLKWIFGVNIVASLMACIVLLIGIVLVFAGKVSDGTIVIIAGTLSEFLVTVFIKQYNTALNRVSDEYKRLLFCNNMNMALNLAKKLPVTDMQGQELRYLEIREILRPLMNNFNDNVNQNDH